MALFHKAKCFLADQVAKPAEDCIENISLKDKSKHCFTFHTKVPVRNRLCVTIPLALLTYSFKTGGKKIASGTINDPGSLTARATTWLEVAVEIPFDIMLRMIKDVADDRDIDYDLEVCLIFDASFHEISLPVRNVGTMKLPTLSSIADLLDGDN